MNNWSDYVKTKGPSAQTGGVPPSAKEYFFIKVTDNWSILLTIILIVFFFCAGAWIKDPSNNISAYFFDAGKVCLGLFIGLLKKEGK
jgi:hypothetical protein